MRRMRLRFMSLAYTFSRASTARYMLELKAAFVPMPSAKAAAPEPASVVTRPPGVTARMRWLPESATYTMPLVGETAMPYG